MDPKREPHDPIEQLLAALHNAERAGVFRATRPDARWVLGTASDPPSRSIWNHTRFRVAAAALLAMAVGVWSLMFYWQIGDLRERARVGRESMLASTTSPGGASVAGLVGCLSGPGGSTVSAECRAFDKDLNGRIDLREVSTLQLAFTEVPGR